MDAQGALAATGLGLQAPQEDLVTGLQAAARDGLAGEVDTGLVEHGTDVAGALR